MSGVDIASDRRGRVPFAVIGVLLLVTSLVLATTLRARPAPTDTAVERALDEMSAASQTAIRDSAATAGRRAAANPVVVPADTPVGRALNESQPFRDALRLRLYLQARERFEQLSAGSEGVEVTASLPPVDTTDGYERAIDRVRVRRAGTNDTAMRATVENVTLTARRGGDVVTRRRVTHSVVVPTPVLYLHDRMETYETRLDNGLGRPGLTQRTTARLYPIAWARGYAQYGGAPIDNVVANRHASLATNGALLGVQRSVFGRSDPAGRQALTEATAVVGVRDLAAGTSNSQLADVVHSEAQYRPASRNISTGGTDTGTPGAGEPMRVGVNETADAAFDRVASPWALNATARAAYSVDVRVVTERTHLGGGRPDRPGSPGENYSFHSEHTTSTGTALGNRSGQPPVPEGWHTLDRFGRVVAVEHRRVATWTSSNPAEPTQTTVSTRTERFAVTAAVIGSHPNESVAPPRGIATAHDRAASPIGGPNLADIEPKAEAALLDTASRDRVAEDIAVGEFGEPTARVAGDRPAEIRRWLYEDLQDLRERVREINTTVERGTVGTFETDPPAELLERVRQRRRTLVGAPPTYDSAAQRARIAARIDYLNAVEARLAARSDRRSTVESGVATQLRERTGGSLTELRRGLTARETQVPRSRPAPTGPAGPVATRVDAQPQYLTLASVSESRVPAVSGTEHPLVARNVNVFSVPYGNAASGALDIAAARNNRASLSTAATALAAANDTEPTEPNETLETRRGALQDAVAESNANVIGALTEQVAVQTDADEAASRAIVRAGLEAWDTTAARGNAIANGSAAPAIAAVAADRRGLSDVETDWLRVRLAETTASALADAGARPAVEPVEQASTAVQTVARDEVESAIADGAERGVRDVAQRRLGRRALPAGLPLAPPVAPWYATMNVWWVTVEGEYARFSVSARHGTPRTPGAETTYARENGEVTLDVDGDGTGETVGRNTRLSFRVDTGIVVVVPPQPRGVGDKDGNSVETSAGWPEPG